MNRRQKLLWLTPLCTLALVMGAAALSPISARNAKAAPVLAPAALQAEPAQPVHLSPADFHAVGGTLSGIVLETLPKGGMLTRSGEPLEIGSVIGAENIGTVSFLPDESGTTYTEFAVRPVFAGHGMSADAVTVSLDLSGTPNSAPIALHGSGETCCGLPLTGTLQAIDPDGDPLSFALTSQPKNGTVTLKEGRFVYTPTGNKARTDAFTFTATDSRGLCAETAAFTIEVHEAESGLHYSDMQDDPNHYAAVRLAELGIFRGEQIGAEHFLYPDAPVTRAQFVAMAASICDLPLPTAAVSTGMADNESVPVWARASMAAALQSDLIEGEVGRNGSRTLRAGDPITHAETAVVLDRMLNLKDDGRKADYAAALPTWAAQAVVDAVEGGYLALTADGNFDPAAPLTRSEAAACLYKAYTTMQAGEKEFWDIF